MSGAPVFCSLKFERRIVLVQDVQLATYVWANFADSVAPKEEVSPVTYWGLIGRQHLQCGAN